jgi:hypothetical protein
MSNPLRAFLMLRSLAGEWEISVVHSLEDLVRAWEGRSDPAMTGIVHCGFVRRVARTFEDLAREHPGRILMTPAGRFALPAEFRSSDHPIGYVEDEAIYLGLEGWGYRVEAPREPVRPASAELQSWLSEYAAIYPGDVAALQDANIFDDAGYLENEVSLPLQIRSRLGAFRTRVKCRGDDPCELAKAAPPWLSERPLEDLGLTVRLSNVFVRHNIRSVGDLSAYSLDQMLEFANFGRKSVRDLIEILERGLAAGVQTAEVRASEIADRPLLKLVEATLQRLATREKDILRRRMGWEGPSQTLADIGESYGITRERIRQIEAKTIKRIVREEYWDDLLASKISAMLVDRQFPLPLAGAEALDPWFSGFAANRSAVEYILSNMCGGRVAIITIDGLEYLSFLTADDWQEIVRSARQLLESGTEQGWSRERCRHLVSGLLPAHSREFSSVLWDKVSPLCHFAGDGDDAVLISYGRGAEALILAILEDSDRPLHYSEIAALASERAGREFDERRAHSAAAEVGYLLGRGSFGTDRHLGYRMDEMMALAEEASAIVNDGPDARQWHASELATAIADDPDWGDRPPNKYVIDVALRLYSSLKRLGRMVWAHADAGPGAARVDLRQAVIATLQQAGGPLTGAELHQRLVAIRGINDGWNFVCGDPVIRLGSGRWGINDRDVPLKRAEQGELQEKLVKMLETRGSGLHISEIHHPDIPGLTSRMLLSLASLDSRIQVSAGQYLYLRAWGSPRRATIGEACLEVLKQSSPIGFEELYGAVVEHVGRACARSDVSSALQGLEARLDESGLWTLEDGAPWQTFEAA